MFTISLGADELINSEVMDEFLDFMQQYFDVYDIECDKLAKELGCSDACAADVMYLRSRSRHTDELEAELIWLHANGTPPNIMEFR